MRGYDLPCQLVKFMVNILPILGHWPPHRWIISKAQGDLIGPANNRMSSKHLTLITETIRVSKHLSEHYGFAPQFSHNALTNFAAFL